MASENKMKDKMTQTTPRQKIIVVVMVIVVLIIIWQVIGLMGSGTSAPAPTIQPASTMNASKPGEKEEMKNTPASAQAAATPASNATPHPSANPQMDESVKQASIMNDPQFNRMQRLTEEKYVGKLNELEELRIQRQIAETNQAIAAAKLATVSAEKDISDLLTKPSSSSSAYSANQPVKTSVDVNPQMPPGSAPPSASEIPKIVPPPAEVVPYKLMSVSLVMNKWTAIVSLQNNLFSVGVGDVLPPDGSVVTNISKNSVTLRKDGKSRKVNISTSF